MRKVMFAMNISIDGCYDHTFFSPDPELMEYFTNLMLDTGLIVYGRKTYELMFPYWPEVAKNRTDRPCDIAFADAMVPIEKIVISRTLNDAGENTRIVNENPEALISELKQTPGKKIALSSTSLLFPFLEVGLIDELYLIVHPMLVGKNKRLFENFSLKLNFELKYSRVFKGGSIALHYQKIESSIS